MSGILHASRLALSASGPLETGASRRRTGRTREGGVPWSLALLGEGLMRVGGLRRPERLAGGLPRQGTDEVRDELLRALA